MNQNDFARAPFQEQAMNRIPRAEQAQAGWGGGFRRPAPRLPRLGGLSRGPPPSSGTMSGREREREMAPEQGHGT
jgi:hypothetical protein